jgi:hypothetical protein
MNYKCNIKSMAYATMFGGIVVHNIMHINIFLKFIHMQKKMILGFKEKESKMTSFRNVFLSKPY